MKNFVSWCLQDGVQYGVKKKLFFECSPTSFIAGALSVPRFLEFELRTDPNGTTDYWTTRLNEDKDYITFSSWWDELIVTGVIPLAALVVFNLRIYLKLRASDRQEYR